VEADVSNDTALWKVTAVRERSEKPRQRDRAAGPDASVPIGMLSA